jgi:hypothetical protein
MTYSFYTAAALLLFSAIFSASLNSGERIHANFHLNDKNNRYLRFKLSISSLLTSPLLAFALFLY